MNNIFYLVLCHLIGDYVLQCDFIAKTKGSNWYHLFVHCALYCVPFVLVYGLDWRTVLLFATHMMIDPLKARWNRISYGTDQVLHYAVALLLYGCDFV
jgi:hypothetical protein